MGNYASSCFCLTHPSPKTAQLIDSHGNMRQVALPSKAGEIMLEEPGHVISPAHELRRTSRVVAMRAEDELVEGKLYLLVSLSRVNCKASAEEMGIIDTSNKGLMNKRRVGGKVLPDVEVEHREEGKDGINDLEDGDMGSSSSGLRKGYHRPWTPPSETISEEF